MAQPETIEVADHARLPAAPLVSVLMVAYKHEAYIAEAIEGVLAQRAPFPFEILIGEDCGGDRTLEIALEYQARHPGLIRVVYARENIGGDENLGRITDLARGKYIAYCDGDDYWCDPLKLARQVEIAEADERIAAVHTDWVRARRTESGWTLQPRSEHAGVARDTLEGDLFGVFYFPGILRACTLMYRREILEAFRTSTLALKRYRFGDTVMAAFITSRWRVGYVDAVTAVYRESPGSALRSGARSKLAFLRSALEFDTDARRFFEGRVDYPQSYRWEIGIGLLLRAGLLRDREAIGIAVADLRAHYGVAGFLRAGWRALRLRLHRFLPAPRART